MSTCPKKAELSSFCGYKQPQFTVSMHRIPNAGLSVPYMGLLTDPNLPIGSELAYWDLTQGLCGLVISGYQQNYEEQILKF